MKRQEEQTQTCLFLIIFMIHWIAHVINLLFNKLSLYHGMLQSQSSSSDDGNIANLHWWTVVGWAPDLPKTETIYTELLSF